MYGVLRLWERGLRPLVSRGVQGGSEPPSLSLGTEEEEEEEDGGEEGRGPGG